MLPENLLRIKPGSSIAVNGVCLTVTRRRGRNSAFDVVPETLQRTNLGLWQPGDKVNIEPSLRVGDELGGHLMLGHVDGVGVVVRTQSFTSSSRQRGSGNKKQKEYILTVRVPKALTPFIAPKGCIAVDGVSLTVVNVKHDAFSAALIPYTLTHTNFGTKKVGDKVNIEVDLIARYLQKLL